MTIESFATGSLLGLAVGDALGAPVEGMKAGHIQQTFERVIDYVDPREARPGRPHYWRLKGLYTDDTQQALAVTDVLTDYGGAELGALAELWVRLLRADTGQPFGGHRGTGRNFIQAVEKMAAEDRTPIECGVPSAGNGAAMRIPPVGLYFYDCDDELMDAALRISLMTHTDPRGIAAAVAVAFTTARLLSADKSFTPEDGGTLAEEIAAFARRAEECLQDDHFKLLDKESRVKHPHAMSDTLKTLPFLVREGSHDLARNSIVKEANRHGPATPIKDANVGFAPASVAISIYYALAAPSFFHGLTDAINDGRDTDTVGAMTGAMLGARFGAGAIPEEWLEGLVNADQVRLRGEALATKSVDWMLREDYVEMETRLTLKELSELADDIKAYKKKKAAADRKKAARSKSKPQPAQGEPLPFAPPPEVWLNSDEQSPAEKQREKERRARRRIDWKETRREKKKMRRKDNEPDK